MQYLIAFALVLVLTLPAAAQQVPHPTADQVSIQILENEARGYRETIGRLAVQVNDLTDAVAALKTKCGKACEETAPAKK